LQERRGYAGFGGFAVTEIVIVSLATDPKTGTDIDPLSALNGAYSCGANGSKA
jgi:hypothetical protein